MVPVIEDTQGTGARVRLVGVTGAGVDAELADVIFPVRTATDELYAIDTTGSQAGSSGRSTLLVERTKDTILSLAVLLKAQFKVDFAVGTEEDPFSGGTLWTSEGHTINLTFRDNLWHVPMWRPPIIIKPTTGAPGVLPDVNVDNYYSMATACRAPMSVNSFMLATVLLYNFYKMALDTMILY